jgi:hypothetical protein
MGDGSRTEYTFDCPECAESLAVNESMRVALEDRGCVVCGATLDEDAFTARVGDDTFTSTD